MNRLAPILAALIGTSSACGPDDSSSGDGQTVTTMAADGSSTGDGTDSEDGTETGSEGETSTETGVDPSCLQDPDPAACCEQVGPELDACHDAGCWDVAPATAYDDQCQPIEVVDTCYPAVWEGMCFGTGKPDGCALSTGDEVVYREVAPGQYVFLIGWELCLGGVPGWTHCFADPDTDPPGCMCAC